MSCRFVILPVRLVLSSDTNRRLLHRRENLFPQNLLRRKLSFLCDSNLELNKLGCWNQNQLLVLVCKLLPPACKDFPPELRRGRVVVLELESETRPIPLPDRTLTGTSQLTFLSLHSFIFKMEISIYFPRLVKEYKIWGFALSSSTFRPPSDP